MNTALKSIVYLLLIVFCKTGKSCICYTPGIRSHYEHDYGMINRAKVIVKGKVLSLTDKDNFGQTAYIHVKITKNYKGALDDTLTFANFHYRSSCDQGFTPGKEYILFLHEDSTGRLIYAPCAGSFAVHQENTFLSEINERTIKILESLSKQKNIASLRYSNGQLMATGKLKNGQPEGKWQIFDFFGNVIETGNYKNGKPDGEWTMFDYDYEFKSGLHAPYPVRMKNKISMTIITWKNGIYKGIIKQEYF